MSERLIVEFYSDGQIAAPLVTVMAFHGGQNAESAAFTLADFFGRMRALKDSRLDDAGVLAARFISWQGNETRRGSEPFDFIDVAIIEKSEQYKECLIVRVYAHPKSPHVELAADTLTEDDDVDAASAILGQFHVGTPLLL